MLDIEPLRSSTFTELIMSINDAQTYFSHHAFIKFFSFPTSMVYMCSPSVFYAVVWQILMFNFSLFEAYAKTQDTVALYFIRVCVFMEFICILTSWRCG